MLLANSLTQELGPSGAISRYRPAAIVTFFLRLACDGDFSGGMVLVSSTNYLTTEVVNMFIHLNFIVHKINGGWNAIRHSLLVYRRTGFRKITNRYKYV